ncbi:hypothetical protein E2C01_048378 [Portunus trituberculatus]|uniref:Ecdysteroid UDP-glucosyltransferase n=1 Tax=Portunus trituberculatus TaxID=210409 RepID=A0A5B7G3N2_PORTR|nr:hypothetical protein [Portunus trituberculatus]
MRLFGKMATVVAVVTVMMMLVKVHEINAARILMAVPIGARSHENFFMPLAEHLTQRNHTVTYLSGFESTKERPNIRVVFVPDVQILKKLRNLFTDNVNTAFAAIFDDMLEVCVKALSYEGVQRLNDEKFDLVILHAGLTECFLSFAHKLKVSAVQRGRVGVTGGSDIDKSGSGFLALLSDSSFLGPLLLWFK